MKSKFCYIYITSVTKTFFYKYIFAVNLVKRFSLHIAYEFDVINKNELNVINKSYKKKKKPSSRLKRDLGGHRNRASAPRMLMVPIKR